VKNKSKGLVILVRGVSGAGKSTHVEELRRKYEKRVRNEGDPLNFVECSADKFRMKMVPGCVDGTPTQPRLEYVFDPTKMAEDHTKCLLNFINAVKEGTRVVVVDNTFIHMWEMWEYEAIADLAEYDVEYHEVRVRTVGDLKACVARNVHRVPADTIYRMAAEFEPMDERERNVKVIPMMGSV
jgi:hypothetical protein